MGLPKGRTNNPNGRPEGSENKITADLRRGISNFLSENWERMQKDFDSLEPKERLAFYEKLLQYGLPRLQSTHLTNDLDGLTDEQLDYVIDDLKSKVYEQATDN